MAKRRRQPELRCQIYFLSDRHVSQKLSEVYRWLVPEAEPPPAQSPAELIATQNEKACRHLRPSLF